MKALTSLLGLALVSSGLAYAPVVQELPPVLQRMVEATKKGRYSATMVMERRNHKGELEKFKQFILKDGPNTRTWFPDDSKSDGQIIVETLRGSKHYFPNLQIVLMTPRLRDEARSRLMNLIESLRKVQVSEGGNLEGRDASKVTFPAYAGQPVQILWIDNDTGIVLRREFRDKKGNIAFSMRLTDLDLHPKITDESFDLKVKGARQLTMLQYAAETATANGFLPALIRPGAHGLELINVRVLSQKEKLLHQIYHSPKGIVSLFQAEAGNDLSKMAPPPGPGLSVYSWVYQGRSFSLIGNQSQEELKKLAGLVGNG